MGTMLHADGSVVNKLLALIAAKATANSLQPLSLKADHHATQPATAQSLAHVVYCAVNPWSPGAHCAHLRKVVG